MPTRLFAQRVRMGDATLSLDLNQIWNYNLYEHSRWGLGVVADVNTKLSWSSKMTFGASFGYGLRDKQAKYRLSWRNYLPKSKRNDSFFITAGREYVPAGSRQMQSSTITDISTLSRFMSQRMSDFTHLTMGYQWSHHATTYRVDAHLFHGYRLFDQGGNIYLVDGDKLPREDGTELSLHLSRGKHWQTNIVAGVAGGKWFAQMLAQYDNTIRIGLFDLTLFVQSGISSPQSPYIRLFDLGGTYGAPVCFSNVLLTALPNEFTASLFAFGSFRFGFREPIFDVWSSLFKMGLYPRPFVGLNTAWGILWQQDEYGQAEYETLTLQSPLLGIAEPLLGIDGLLRWGLVDYGLAIAYRFVPQSATYYRPNVTHAWMFTAKISL